MGITVGIQGRRGPSRVVRTGSFGGALRDYQPTGKPDSTRKADNSEPPISGSPDLLGDTYLREGS
jgi:hypothetical protein